MSVKERLKKYIKSKNITIKSFEDSINASNGYVNSISKGIGNDYLERIRDKYPDLDIKWLLFQDELEKLENKTNVLEPNVINTEKSLTDIINDNDLSEIKKIPFYDVDFYSGFTQIFNDQTIQPSYYFYLPEFHNAQLAIKNSGKSMSKELGSDDILGLRQIEDWREYFPQGEIYAVVTSNDLRTIKKVRRNEDNTKLVLIPKPIDEDKFDYPEYEEIPIKMVVALFQVVASTNSKKLAL